MKYALKVAPLMAGVVVLVGGAAMNWSFSRTVIIAAFAVLGAAAGNLLPRKSREAGE